MTLLSLLSGDSVFLSDENDNIPIAKYLLGPPSTTYKAIVAYNISFFLQRIQFIFQ